MRLDILEERVSTGVCTGGHFNVYIIYRGDVYTCISTNTLAYDRLSCDVTYKSQILGLTYKQALQSLYDECKRKNRLGEFNFY